MAKSKRVTFRITKHKETILRWQSPTGHLLGKVVKWEKVYLGHKCQTCKYLHKHKGKFIDML